MNSTVLPYFSAGVRYAGAVDYLEPQIGIRGWLIDPQAPGVPLALEAWCSGTLLATTVAVLDRPDIDKVLGRTTQCGFLVGWSRFDRAAMEKLAAKNPDAPLNFVVAGEGSEVPVVREPIPVSECLRLLRASPKGDRGSAFTHLNDYLEVAASRLFDEDWYLRTQPDLAPGVPPLLDYLRRTEARGGTPSLYFDPAAYAQEAELDTPAGALIHYIRNNLVTGLTPSLHFDARWYRNSNRLAAGVLPLAHFMARRREKAPNRWFDPAYYLARCGAPGVADPYEHFLREGRAAGIAPAAPFEPGRTGPGASPREGVAFLKALARYTPPGAAAAAPAAPVPAAPQRPATPPPAAPVVAAPPVPPAVAAAPPRAAPPLAVPPGRAEAKPRRPGPVEAPKVAAPSVSIPPAANTQVAPPSIAAPPVATPPPLALPPESPLHLGFAGTEAKLRSLSLADVAVLVRQAEQDLQGKPERRLEAALLLAVARSLTGDAAGAARAQMVFLQAPALAGLATNGEIEARFASANHTLYEARNRTEAAEIYRLLHRRGFQDLLVALRLLEIALDTGDLAGAAPYAAELERDYADRLNVWGFLALSRFRQMKGDTAKSVQILRALPHFPATEAIAEAVIAHRLIEGGALDDAEARLAAVGESKVPEIFQARFRLAVRRGTAGSILAAEERRCAADLPDWVLSEAMFLSTLPGTVPSPAVVRTQLGLYRLLQVRPLDSRPVVQARIHYLLHQKRWDELGVLFGEVDNTPLAKDRETLLRKLEYFCHADNPEEAERIYQTSFVGTALNKWESLTILRLLSELKRWEEAGKVLLNHVASGFGFAGGTHVAMRIVRKAAVHQAIMERVGGLSKEELAQREADLGDFLHMVNEDHVIVQSARALTSNIHTGAGATRYRSNWLLTNSDPSGEEHADYCLFLCTNQRYFLSLLTFLCSFLGQAPQVGGRIFIFLDRDVPRHWYGSVAMVAARFGRAIDIVPEEDFMPKDGVDHRVEYGFFAGGSNLSRAAYFRLYAARWLLLRHKFRRAVYTDTDIVCRADMTGMFELDLGDKLMAARVEDYSPEVINAASRNGLDPHAYFNSGVLLLRFDDPRLSQFIEEAIRVSEVEPDRLVFHDQCALNIAFQDQFAPLPARYNFFLRPSRERNGFIEDGVLLHYLDKPKPWDIVFDRTYREEWRVWALVLGSILPQGLYVDIFAAGNRD